MSNGGRGRRYDHRLRCSRDRWRRRSRRVGGRCRGDRDRWRRSDCDRRRRRRHGDARRRFTCRGRRTWNGHGRRRYFGRLRVGARSRAVLDQVVELSVAQGDEHRLVLLLHHRPHCLGHRGLAEVLGVRRLRRLEDASTVREEVGDDVRVPHPRVLGLDVEYPSLVADVVVEAEEWRRSFHDEPVRGAGEEGKGGAPPCAPKRLPYGKRGADRQRSRSDDRRKLARGVSAMTDRGDHGLSRRTWVRGRAGVRPAEAREPGSARARRRRSSAARTRPLLR